MQEEKIITGKNEDEVWQQLTADLTQHPDLLNYRAVIEQDSTRVVLEIDIDLGGGFESGYATTRFTAPLQRVHNFQFAIHEEDILDAAGKFFGMQDVIIGHPEFDKKVIVKTNDELRVKIIFSDKIVREVIGSLTHFTFQITLHDNPDSNKKAAFLLLNIENGITDPHRLREIYHAFFNVVVLVDSL